MRSYQKTKQTINEVEQDDLELPALPLTCPPEIWNTAASVRTPGDRDPTQFSEPSVQMFHITMKLVDIQLQKAHLTTIEHLALEEKVRNEEKRKITSRRSIHKGGPSATIDEPREQKKARDEVQDQGDGDEDDVIIRLEASQQKEEVLDYIDSSPPLPNYVDSSDVESNAGSLDSIQRNADFVQF
jgi:hypothetical protein